MKGTAALLVTGMAMCVSAIPRAHAEVASTGDPQHASENLQLTPQDFAYRMQVMGTGTASAYRLTLPLVVYRKIAHPDLSDLRVFNGNGEPVPFALERPAALSIAGATHTLPTFPLKDDSSASLNAFRVTVESGSGAINVRTAEQPTQPDRIGAYLVDARTLDSPLSALELEWPADAADFAGRLKVEYSDSLDNWQLAVPGAPIANLHSAGQRLVEPRVETGSRQAKYWRLSWVGAAPPFVLTAVTAEPSKQNVDAKHLSLTAEGAPVAQAPGDFEFDLGASPPVDRVNLQLPETNTVVEVELLSRSRPTDTWRSIRRSGFYRLKSEAYELRNGPVSVPVDTDRYWLARVDRKGGGLGSGIPQLVAEWVPHQLVFVARGTAPFSIAYGSAAARSAAVSLAAIPRLFSIADASLAAPEALGGEARLLAPPTPYPWKSGLLWAILLIGAGLLARMAFRLFKDVGRNASQ